jgi:pyruvyl transferase EpsO
MDGTAHEGVGTPLAATPGAMERLKRRLDAAVAPALGRSRRVAYADLPLHGNLGDQLIAEGTEAFLAAHGVEVVLRMSESDFDPARLAALPRDVVLLWHGGGNMGDLWPFFERMRRRAVAACHDRRVVLLPQSVHFRDATELARAGAEYGAHPDLVLFVRDRRSLELARARLARDVRLAPDMAHALWGLLDWHPRGADDTLALRRRDGERREGAPDGGLDWGNLVPRRRMAHLLAHRVLIRQAARFSPAAAGPLLYRSLALARRRALEAAARGFRCHQRIVTDRLHATILGALLGLEVEAEDNSYGKIARYWAAWADGGAGEVAAGPQPRDLVGAAGAARLAEAPPKG